MTEVEALAARLDALVDRLRPSGCPFCRRDPYHYVDNGVGMERVAVTCCDLGISLIQYRDEQLLAMVSLMGEAADAITALRSPAVIAGETWQPIETAPKDGRYIIAARFKQDELRWIKQSRWMDAAEAAELEGCDVDEVVSGWTDGDDRGDYCCPSHWMPLNARPSLSGKEER